MASIQIIDGDVELIHIRTWHSIALDLTVYIPLIANSLFDSGPVKTQKKLLKFLSGRRLERIIHTHGHEDHVGNDFQLLREHNCEIWAPKKSLPLICNKQNIALYRKFFWGTPTAIRQTAITIVPTEFQIGKFTFQSIPTPGHSEDLVGYFEPNRGWFVGGDLFLGEQIKASLLEENGHDAIQSLEKVIQLKPRIFFCYHQSAILDPIPKLSRKLAFMKQVRDEILRYQTTGMPTEQIVKRVLGRESSKISFITGGETSKLNYVRSFLKRPGIYS